MKTVSLIACAATLLTATGTALADADAGKALHDENCLKCHGPEIYTREDHRVKDLAGLKKQVSRCELSLGLKWFDEDIDNVVEYVNANFYKFEK